MPTDLEQAFATLREDANRARLEPAATLRHRADRRTRVRSLAAVTAVAVLVCVAVFGAHGAVRPEDRAVPSAPSPTASAAALTTIPDRAFLGRSDVPGGSDPSRLGQPQRSPGLCGERTYASDARVDARASRTIEYRALGAQTGPADGAVTETIVAYRPGGAPDFMAEFRDAVGNCAAAGGDTRWEDLGGLDVGDASLLVRTTWAGPPGDPQPRTESYVAVVRVGDDVAILENTQLDALRADRADTEAVAATAADRLAAWR